MDIIDRKNCPVCGTPVVVVSGDEGTCHYEPVYDKEKNAEIRKLQEELARLKASMKRVPRKEG